MRTVILNLALAAACMGMMGCVPQPQPQQYQPTKVYDYSLNESSSYSDNKITVSAIPERGSYNTYKGITVTLENKTKDDIRIVWNDSYFIYNGNADGGLMPEGTKFVDKDAPKQDFLVLPEMTSNKTVWPSNYVIYIPYDRLAVSMGLPAGWENKALKEGSNGVYILVKGKNYENRIKLMFDIELKTL